MKIYPDIGICPIMYETEYSKVAIVLYADNDNYSNDRGEYSKCRNIYVRNKVYGGCGVEGNATWMF